MVGESVCAIGSSATRGILMGMDAELLAIGPFSREVADALGYPPDFYDDTPTGALIISTVACCNNTECSRDLATALGIEPWNFEQHCEIDVDLAKVDLGLFAESVEGGSETVADFLKLALNEFKFYYMPNG